MSLQLSAVTLGVKDINRAKKFYNEGLGCAVDQDHPGFVSLKVGDSKVSLGLYTTDALADDAGMPAEGGSGFRGVVLNYIVEGSGTEERIGEVLAQAKRAGGHNQGCGACAQGARTRVGQTMRRTAATDQQRCAPRAQATS